MTGELPIDVRQLIDVIVETPSNARRTNTTGKLPCIPKMAMSYSRI